MYSLFFSEIQTKRLCTSHNILYEKSIEEFEGIISDMYVCKTIWLSKPVYMTCRFQTSMCSKVLDKFNWRVNTNYMYLYFKEKYASKPVDQ